MSEQLTSFVSDGSSISMHSLIRNIGQGSNRQDGGGVVLIILSTASSETCPKTVTSFSVPEGAKVSLIFLILFQKKEANWSVNDFSDACDGSVASSTLFWVLSSSHQGVLES